MRHTIPALTWASDDRYSFEVVGESYRHNDLKQLFDLRDSLNVVYFETALLHEEKNNEHDPNAVAVYLRGTKVGYIPKEIAPLMREEAKRLDYKKGFYIARALTVCRKWDSSECFSVKLDISDIEGQIVKITKTEMQSVTERLSIGREIIRVDNEPQIAKSLNSDTRYIFVGYIDSFIADIMGIGFTPDVWTKPELDFINLYADTGLKICSLPKDKIIQITGSLDNFSPRVFCTGHTSVVFWF